MSVRWVLWDLGDVLELCGDGTWQPEWGARFASELGLSLDDFHARLAAADLPPADVADVEQEFWSAFAGAVGASPPLMSRMVEDYWDAYCGVENTELVSYVRSLRGRANLAVLSNSGAGARREEERRYGWSGLFDPICYSHEIGFKKPDERAFAAALTAMGAAADEVLFVDNALRCVEGARAVGIAAVQHVDNATTIAAVEAALRPGA